MIKASFRARVVCAILFLCTGLVSRADAQTTALFLDSAPGDPIGQSQQRTLLPPATTFNVNRTFDTGPGVQASVFSSSTFWSLQFDAGGAAALGVGEYLGATSPRGGLGTLLSVSGPGVCSRRTGRFAVLEIERSPEGTILKFAADFEQHCEGTDAALVGALRYNSTISSLVPFGGAYPSYSLAVPRPAHGTVTGGGLTCGAAQDPCEQTFSVPTSVELTATPDPGYSFLGWAGCSGDATTTVRVNQPTRCEPIFESATTATPITTLLIDRRDGTVEQRQYNLSNATFSGFEIDFSNGRGVHISVDSDTFWSLDFDANAQQALTPGTYLSARRYSSNGAAAGLSISGSSFCSTITGRFVVHEVVFATNGTLERFAADFEQHCEDADGAVFGAIRYRSTIGTVQPFGGAYPLYRLAVSLTPGTGTVTDGEAVCDGTLPCEWTFTSPASVTLTAVPASGFVFTGWSGSCAGTPTVTVRVNQPKECRPTFQSATAPPPYSLLFVDSQPGDTVAQGRRTYMNGANAVFTLSRIDTSAGAGVRVNVAGETSWSIEFDAPMRTPLAAGTYQGAVRYPFNGGRAGLSVSGNNVFGCNQVTGWFVVHELDVNGSGAITRFAADFEYHCNNADPGLFGAVRFNSTMPATVPFGGSYPEFGITIGGLEHGTVTGAAIACAGAATPCVRTFDVPTTITITAAPDPGYVFLGWAGSCSGGATVTVRVNQPVRCDAVFRSTTATDPYTSLFLDSQAGDSIGQGRQWFYNPSNAIFTVQADDTFNGPGMRVSIVSDTTWTVSLDAPARAPLGLGTFFGAIRYPFNGSRAGLDISGDGRGCNTETGWFIVRQLETNLDGSIARFAADIEQHCSNADPGLFAAVRYNSTIPSPTPFDGAYPLYRLGITPAAHGTVTGPGLACGPLQGACVATLTAPETIGLSAVPDPGYIFLGWTDSCDGGATTSRRVNQRVQCEALFDSLAAPSPRTTVFFDSQPGDFIGQGRQWLYNTSNAQLTASRIDTSNGTGVRISVSADTNWSVEFDADGRRPLAVGTYRGAIRSPFNDLSAGLNASGNGRGCNQNSGWFVVRELQVATDGSILKFAADFEQHCEHADPALFGSVRYNSSIPTIAPFDGNYPDYHLTIIPAAHGVVTGAGLACGPSQGACAQTLTAPGTIVLTATPERGYALRGWSGDCTGTRVTAVRVNSSRECSAVFVPTVVPHDLDGDGLGDVAIWRPGDGTFYWGTSSSGFNDAAARARQWGSTTLGDRPFLGDVDGDAVEDLIVWRASSGTWFWLPSSGGYSYAAARSVQWGNQGLGDVPMIGDMDGDGRTDFVIWRPGNGTFYWLTSTSGYSYAFARGVQWGNQALGDQPLLGDFDGDGLQHLAVWRASNGTWYWLTSSSVYSYAAARGVQWGSQALGDKTFTGDMDGDGRSELIVWRPGSGTWFWLSSTAGYDYASQRQRAWGSATLGDVPAVGDFDGDRNIDLGVWRGPTGTWYWLTSSSGYDANRGRAKQWGSLANGDIPMVR